MEEENNVHVDLGEEENNGGPVARFHWDSVRSGFILRRFAELVSEGLKTDKGFKEVQCNAVAKDLSEFAQIAVSGTQVHNHLRKWRSKWGKICRLKNLSAALWDDTNFVISLDQEHYNGHIKSHPKDADFLNTPLVNYQALETIFGGGVATGRYAMGSNEPLDMPETEAIDLDAETPIEVDEDPLPSVTKPKLECTRKGKRKRVADEEATLMTGLTDAIKGFSAAVSDAVPGLYQAVMSCPGFTREALMAALGHLTEKKANGLMFVEMIPDDRELWLRTYLAKNYYM
ncbi:hypothetical protein U9M48_029396 [Paspalum notatum var. saurae]|uniref:Myb/SANT-like domain-containing protein n=1 Tax=Paspalum notatum var. saurae TaxID=547442 RepID=A0AAQ3TXS7_PASNO